ncbi:hypothetical protein BJ742DRAFT_864370 [Cladochytrium replicatum]|nr:hypothetical protein BJ742DRAFT_864370 [Cladochytrium replicatum]
MAQIAVIGGTRGVGLEFVKLALAQKCKLNVLARFPEKLDLLTAGRENLNIIKGDALSLDDVKRTVEGTDTIFLSLDTAGGGHGAQADICSVATPTIIEAAKAASVKKIVVVTSLGVAESFYEQPMVLRFFLWLFIGRALADKEIQEKQIRESGLEFIIVRPGQLLDGPPTGGKYEITKQAMVGIARGDVAEFSLKAITSQSEHWGQAVGLGGKKA